MSGRRAGSTRGRFGSRRGAALVYIVIALVVLLLSAGTIASVVIDYQWWKEMGQLDTWYALWLYRTLPAVLAAAAAFAAIWIAYTRGLTHAGGAQRGEQFADLRRLALGGMAVGAILIALAAIDSDTFVRFFGSRRAESAGAEWTDPVFGRSLSFYLFDLPFLRMILGYAVAVGIIASLVHWAAARVWGLADRMGRYAPGQPIDLSDLFRGGGSHETHFLRGLAAALLLTMAAYVYLARYEMLLSEHGFLVGMDYLDETVRLPLNWVMIGVFAAGAAAALMGRWRLLLVIPAVWLAYVIVPAAIGALYVRPNEITLERPYLERHLASTRAAYGLEERVRETDFETSIDSRPIATEAGFAKHKLLLDNVRLWDWRAFHDTITQIQALRPYYVFPDADVDRYIINGKLQQVMVSARELDIRQLPDAQTRWINPHFVYTHGYGVVMAGANQIRPDGLPLLYVQDAPPVISTPSLKLTRPEIYYGESTHEPVFVNSAEPEFSYPTGAKSEFVRYAGTGGFPVSSYAMRLAAAVREGDFNILLTSLVTENTRMMIHRRVDDRLDQLAGFIDWDDDPYLVLTEEGRLVWTMDGYTTSNRHPYAHRLFLGRMSSVNYIRNSVKATVDAYTGETRLYIFDAADPLIRAYQGLFPTLFRPASEMPAALRKHVRYPETIFRIQAEAYRLFHMRDPQAFYNKEDVWDIARRASGAPGEAATLEPTYIVATLPGENEPELLLLLPYTPRNKDNMVALMVARCDGENLGEIRVLLLSKQELVFGPMQISARINQDQNISKDLNLWNQQGSQVVRGQLLVLPIEDNFLYVSPIYLQSAQARMPQLKKVVLALGDALVYRDTYSEALAELAGMQPSAVASEVSAGIVSDSAPPPASSPEPNQDTEKLRRIRDRLRRYRELASQGKWSEAGRELEALEALAAGQ